MSSAAVYCLSLWLGAASQAAGPLESKDAATLDGRSVLQYRAIEFRTAPAKPKGRPRSSCFRRTAR